jgi:hypothetical protein
MGHVLGVLGQRTAQTPKPTSLIAPLSSCMCAHSIEAQMEGGEAWKERLEEAGGQHWPPYSYCQGLCDTGQGFCSHTPVHPHVSIC